MWICRYIYIYIWMCVCVRKVPSRVPLNVMPYILAGIRGDFCANKSLRWLVATSVSRQAPISIFIYMFYPSPDPNLASTAWVLYQKKKKEREERWQQKATTSQRVLPVEAGRHRRYVVIVIITLMPTKHIQIITLRSGPGQTREREREKRP